MNKKMKLIRFLNVAIVISFFAVNIGNPVFANGNKVVDTLSDNIATTSRQLPSHSVKDTITVDGKTVDLFSTFGNQANAMSQIKTELSVFLNKVQEYYDLENLSDLNYDEYSVKAREYVSKSKETTEDDRQDLVYFLKFVDIYENDSFNAQTIEFWQEQAAFSTKNSKSVQELASMLPYTSDLWQEYAGKSSLARSAFSVTDGIKYAEDYAVNHNSYSEYYYFSNGDCANFASQILEAGGVSQVVYDSIYNGWWHKYEFLQHTHSQSWS